MFDTICTLPLSSDLFAQSIHPSAPVFAVGLASGHVETYRLPAPSASSSLKSPVAKNGTIETSWRTKRHKGSCRSLAFSTDGEQLYSAGTDGIVKIASVETGRVAAKIAVPREGSTIDAPSLLHALSPQSLLLATDTSALHLYDLRVPPTPTRPQQTHFPHDDYISSLTPLPPTEATTSGFSKQWVSTGGTTLAVTDLRRGVLVKSEDQEEELLSSVFVGGLASKKAKAQGGGEKVLVGDGSGVITIWERGMWEDQGERIVLGRKGLGEKESVDVLAAVPEGVVEGKCVVVGMGDGVVRVVRVGVNQVVGELRHDEVEGVIGLGFEVEGRMISGGGAVVKVWEESAVGEEEDGGQGEGEGIGVGMKREMEGSESEEGREEDDSSEEEMERKRRKKRKRGKGKDRSGNQHVMAFKGMD